jgi:hypothetical protein
MSRVVVVALLALAVSASAASAAGEPFYVRPATVERALISDGLHLTFGKQTISTRVTTASCSGRGHASGGRYVQFVCRIGTPKGASSIKVRTFTRNVSNWFYTWSY